MCALDTSRPRTPGHGPASPRRLATLLMAMLSLAWLPGGCGAGDGDPGPREPRTVPLVLTTTWPLHDIARELAGDAAEVACALPPDQDVRTWTPNRAELAALADADLVVCNGAGLEPWRTRASLPRARSVDASAGFADRLIERDSGVSHSHGNGEQHSHTGTDPHVWLDPELLALQVRAVLDGLRRVVAPERRELLDERGGVLLDRITGFADRLAALRARGDRRVHVATHPTWAYLARRLDLRVVEVEVGAAADAAAVVARIRAALGNDEAASVLWERQPPAALAAALGEQLGVPQVVVPPDVQRGEAGEAAPPLAWLERGVTALEAVVGR